MKEIGGYLELDQYHLPMLHEGAVGLNLGRNCLAYLIEARQISRIVLPYFLCSCVRDVCARYRVRVRYYHITEDFLPESVALAQDEWMYAVNYYGQLTPKQLADLAAAYPRIIFDQVQAYFAPPVPGADNIYTCRKFFGVADGAFLETDAHLDRQLVLDESFDRMRYLLGRFERTAAEFYQERVGRECELALEPLKRMSKLTENLLHGIDYAAAERRRTENYEFLASQLNFHNELKVRNVNGAFAYPLLRPDGAAVRKKLIAEKIYVPVLWPNVLEDDGPNTLERRLAQDILPLPCDQRYDIEMMRYLLQVLGL